MQLTNEEKDLLSGERGEAIRRAMELLVSIGEFYDARDMVKIGSVHSIGAYEVAGDAGLEFVEEMERLGASCKVPATLHGASVDLSSWSSLGQEEPYAAKQIRLTKAYERMGFLSIHSGLPFQYVLPTFGENLGWGETFVVVFANSVIGARSNIEGPPSSLAAALTGRVPRYGFHLDERRRANVGVDVTADLLHDSDWNALGYKLGELLREYWSVPLIRLKQTGTRPSTENLKRLAREVSAYGSLAMFHVLGVTPEARTQEQATNGAELGEKITIGRDEIRDVYEMYGADDKRVEVVAFGSPPLSLVRMKELASYLKGKKVNESVKLLVFTDAGTKAFADRMGYAQVIEASRGVIVCDTDIPMFLPSLVRRFGYERLLTDNVNSCHYIRLHGVKPTFRPTDECIDAAVRGVLTNG
jgi:predicted aconitase